jgi:hypothetical protein
MTGAKLIISKLNWLSPDIHFLTGLQRAGIYFAAVENPNANRLTAHILIAVAQHEREVISERTSWPNTWMMPHAQVRGCPEANGLGRLREREAVMARARSRTLRSGGCRRTHLSVRPRHRRSSACASGRRRGKKTSPLGPPVGTGPRHRMLDRRVAANGEPATLTMVTTLTGSGRRGPVWPALTRLIGLPTTAAAGIGAQWICDGRR